MNRFTLSLLTLSLLAFAGCGTFSSNPSSSSPDVVSNISEQKIEEQQLIKSIRKSLIDLDSKLLNNSKDKLGSQDGASIVLGAIEDLESIGDDLRNLQGLLTNSGEYSKAYDLSNDLIRILKEDPGEVNNKYIELKEEIDKIISNSSDYFGGTDDPTTQPQVTPSEADSEGSIPAILPKEQYTLLLTGGSLALSLISFFFALRASLRVKNRSIRHEKEIRSIREEIDLERFRKEVKQEIKLQFAFYKSQSAKSTFPVSNDKSQAQLKLDVSGISSVDPSSSLSVAVSPPVPKGPSKQSLINALNSGDRQALKEAATAELNITSDSESAIAMGKSVTTELEVVPGGGSYWLIELQGKALLFPTDRTLNGFSDFQPVKGIFSYEQQTISKAQLIDPASLEGSGTHWRVQTMGRVATP